MTRKPSVVHIEVAYDDGAKVVQPNVYLHISSPWNSGAMAMSVTIHKKPVSLENGFALGSASQTWMWFTDHPTQGQGSHGRFIETRLGFA
jgi:hypothetical protein